MVPFCTPIVGPVWTPIDNVHDAALPDSAFDEAILRQLFTGLSMGEPNPDCPNPWADLFDEPQNGHGTESDHPDEDGTVEDGVTSGEDDADGEWGDDGGE